MNSVVASRQNTIYGVEKCLKEKVEKTCKKQLTYDMLNGIIFKLTREGQQKQKKKIKKFLTKRNGFDKISKLSLERERQEP